MSWSRSTRAILATTLGLAVVLNAGEAVSQAQDKSERRKQEQVEQAPVPSDVASPTYSFRPYIETEAGYDSNPDNLFEKDASGFVKLEGGLKASAVMPGQFYGLTLKGRFIEFVDFEDDISHRSDFKAALDTAFRISPAESFKTGAYFLRDLISLARADIIHSYSDYSYQGQNFRLKVLGKSHVEHNFDNDVDNGDPFFSSIRDRAFDFVRSDGQVNLLTFTDSFVQPFAIVDASVINYYNQTTGALINRDATEQYGIAGTRLKFDKNFRIDVGYRVNHRQFDDSVFRRFTSNYIDVNIFWQPNKDVKITGIVERFLQEPNTSLGLADDVRAYGVTVDWRLAPQWRFVGTGTYLREDALGDDLDYRKLVATLALTYDADKHTEVFISTLGKWVEERISGDTYDRYKIGVGVRLKF